MRVIDVDPNLLRDYSRAAIHSGVEAWTHMEAEFVGDIDGLMDTLVPDEPYAYTIVPQVLEDGSVRSPVISTYDEIRECYKFVRGRSALLSGEPLVDINGTWYTFHENVNRGRVRGQDKVTESYTIAIFPGSTGPGITGELVWAKYPKVTLGPRVEGEDAMLEGTRPILTGGARTIPTPSWPICTTESKPTSATSSKTPARWSGCRASMTIALTSMRFSASTKCAKSTISIA
jgi:hypothetical protein